MDEQHLEFARRAIAHHYGVRNVTDADVTNEIAALRTNDPDFLDDALIATLSVGPHPIDFARRNTAT